METVKKIIRLYGKRNFAVTVAVAILLGCAFWWEMEHFFRRRALALKDPRYLVLQREIPAGRFIDFADLGFLTSDAIDGKSAAGALTDQDLPLLRNARSSRVLGAGEFLRRQDLVSARGLSVQIPRGRRAYSARFADGVFGRPGDWVDIYLTPANSDQPRLLIEWAKVLKISGDVEAVLALTGEEIQEMEKAQQRGKLTMALRNPDEPPPTGGRSRPLKSRRKQRNIEIHSESE